MSYDPLWRPINGTGQSLTIGATSVTSAAFGTQTYAIRLSATGNCHVAFNGATAVSTDLLVKSTDYPETYRVTPGEKVSVIQDGASTGTLNVIEMTH